MEELATFEVAARAKYLDVLRSPVDEAVGSSLHALIRHLEEGLPSLAEKLQVVEVSVAKNEAALATLLRERVDFWDHAGAQLLHVLRFCISARNQRQEFSQRPAHIDGRVPRDLRNQYLSSWKRARRLAERDERTARRARDHLVGLFQKAGRTSEIPALEAAASWSSRQPNADLMVALSR